jgi:hypothetical protein
MPTTLPGLTDTLAHTPTNYNAFTPPVLGASYVDPVFGSTVRRLTADRNFDDIYAKNMCFNADATKYAHGGNIVSTATGLITHTVPRGSFTGDAGFDPVDPNVYYYLFGTTIRKVSLGPSGAKSDVTFFTATAAIDSLGQSVNWWSADGSLFLVNFGGSVKVIDKATMTPLIGTIAPPTGGGWLGLAPSGKHAIGYWSNNGMSWKIDPVAKTVGSQVMFWAGLCGDHAVAISSSDGHDYGVVQDCNNFDEIWRIDVDSNAAGKTEAQQRAMPGSKMLYNAFPWQNEKHFSSVARGALQDWCFVSMEYPKDAIGSVVPPDWPAYRQEIIAINVLTGEIRRICHHHSRSIPDNYGYQCRLTSSWAGELIGFASNMNLAGGSDIFAAAFGDGSAPIPVPPDTSKPIVSILSPQTGASVLVGASLPLTATVSDDRPGVGAVGWTVNGVIASSPYTFAIPGSYTVVASAVDASGNIGMDSRVVTVTAVVVPPIPPLTTLTPGTYQVAAGGSVTTRMAAGGLVVTVQ